VIVEGMRVGSSWVMRNQSGVVKGVGRVSGAGQREGNKNGTKGE